MQEMTILLKGLTCANCAGKIEHAINRQSRHPPDMSVGSIFVMDPALLCFVRRSTPRVPSPRTKPCGITARHAKEIAVYPCNGSIVSQHLLHRFFQAILRFALHFL